MVSRARRRRVGNSRNDRAEDDLRYARCFLVTAALRFLCVIPWIIDDDEAWWSASALALRSPWDFYRKAVDDKPPGAVWFYWCVAQLFPHGDDPRVARAVFTALYVAGAALL